MRQLKDARYLILLPVAAFLALSATISFSLAGKCDCAVAGAVCGDAPTWDPCCEPDKYECKKLEGETYGTCEEKKGAEK